MGKVGKPVQHGTAKVPVIMQMEALECGAACLTMVLAYYGKWLPLEQVRKDCGVSRDGSNAKNVLMAARSYGLEASGYKHEVETLRKNGVFPCILFWNFNHFVVLCGFRGNNAVLNDPARGRVEVSMKEFDEAFTGVCLQFAPTDAFEPGGSKSSLWKFTKERLKGSAGILTLIILMTVITSVVSMVNPAFSRVFLDRILSGKNADWLTPFIIILFAFNALQLAISFARETYMRKVQGKFAVTSNSKFMWHVLRMPVEFFSQRMAGDIASRRGANESISNMLIQTFAPLFLDLITLVIYATVIIRYSPVLTAVGVAALVANMLLSRYITKKRMNISRVSQRDSGKLSGATVAAVEMIETIKSSGAENGFFGKWAGYQALVNASQTQGEKLDASLGSIPGLVSAACNIIVLLLGVMLVILGQWTVGMILAFQGYLGGFMSPVNNMISAGSTVQGMRSEMERIQDVMEYPADVEFKNEPLAGDAGFDKLSGNIEIKNVTFGYARLAPPLIEGFSLSIKPGNKIAIVGLSGCGKSTIAKLVSGLYEPWSGEILFDGKKRCDIPREVFTGSLAVVDQDITLFEDTVSNNIRMWDSSIENFAVVCAARDADIHKVIMQRKDGYQHKILKGGADFSGGQRQRLEIARVLAQDPTMVIMDEATSALDTKTEYNVVKSIQDRGITTIVIAHRLSMIRDADEIIVLDKGKVVERGTHRELFAKDGVYKDLVASE